MDELLRGVWMSVEEALVLTVEFLVRLVSTGESLLMVQHRVSQLYRGKEGRGGRKRRGEDERRQD